MALSVPLQELTFGACPYLPGAPPWKVSIFSCWEIPAGIYEALLGRGFRRSGASFYCTICDGCDRCIPIRIDAAHFKPTNSQRRVERRNADLDFYFDPAPSGVLPDRFRLYQKFCRDRFGRVLNPAHGADSYTSFLVESPLGAVAVTSYSVASPSGPELVGNGYLDVLPDGLSSIYFAWSMAHGRRSPGVYSILREIELCRALGKRWYYLGFWVPGSRAMDYKADFGPAEIARGDSWQPLGKDLRDTLRGSG